MVRKRNAFTLVELMIVAVIGLIISAAVVSILRLFILDFEQTYDITAARQRGEMVVSILEGPVLHAGLGMPDEGDLFGEAFASGKSGELSGVAGRGGTIVVDGSASGDLYVTYAVPGGILTEESADFSAGSVLSPSLRTDVPSGMVEAFSGSASDTKNWVTFPTAGVPFLVTDTADPGRLGLKAFSAGSGKVALYDGLHYIRAMKAYVAAGPDGKRAFYTEDLTLGSPQPRVRGVEKIYFSFMDEVLSVYVLCRGNKEDATMNAGRKIYGWDETVLPPIDAGSKRYRLAVTKGSWRIRN